MINYFTISVLIWQCKKLCWSTANQTFSLMYIACISSKHSHTRGTQTFTCRGSDHITNLRKRSCMADHVKILWSVPFSLSPSWSIFSIYFHDFFTLSFYLHEFSFPLSLFRRASLPEPQWETILCFHVVSHWQWQQVQHWCHFESKKEYSLTTMSNNTLTQLHSI